MIELHQTARILTAPEHRRRDNPEQDTDAQPARLDLYHNGEKHHGEQQHLQHAAIYDNIHTCPPSTDVAYAIRPITLQKKNRPCVPNVSGVFHRHVKKQPPERGSPFLSL